MTNRRSVIKSIFLLGLIAALGFVTKLLPVFEGTWVANNLSGLFYVTELCLVVYIVFPGNPAFIYGLVAFLLTSILEFLQLWEPQFLMSIRGSFVGHTILGSSFSWMDFLFYLGGALLGWLLLQWVIPKRM